MAIAEPRIHRWTREEYYTMAETGLFEGRHVELIEGQVIDMSPMGSLHATAVGLAGRALEKAFGPGFFARCQMSLDVSQFSEPEPDIAVIQGGIRDFKDAHPKTAVLIVEVADSSLNYDRNEKASLYAKLGIADYWVLNLVDNQLEVCRKPVPDASGRFDYRYADVTIFNSGHSIETLADPRIRISVDDLLP